MGKIKKWICVLLAAVFLVSAPVQTYAAAAIPSVVEFAVPEIMELFFAVLGVQVVLGEDETYEQMWQDFLSWGEENGVVSAQAGTWINNCVKGFVDTKSAIWSKFCEWTGIQEQERVVTGTSGSCMLYTGMFIENGIVDYILTTVLDTDKPLFLFQYAYSSTLNSMVVCSLYKDAFPFTFTRYYNGDFLNGGEVTFDGRDYDSSTGLYYQVYSTTGSGWAANNSFIPVYATLQEGLDSCVVGDTVSGWAIANKAVHDVAKRTRFHGVAKDKILTGAEGLTVSGVLDDYNSLADALAAYHAGLLSWADLIKLLCAVPTVEVVDELEQAQDMVVDDTGITEKVLSEVTAARGTLESIWDVVTDIPNAIISGLKSLLISLFVPNQQNLQNNINNQLVKLAFITEAQEYFLSLQNLLLNVSEPPVIMIDFRLAESKYNWGGKAVALDLTWYARYKPYADLLICAFLYALFFLNLFRHIIPTVLQGAPTGLSDAKAISDFNNRPAEYTGKIRLGANGYETEVRR